jgi:chemotaxis protein histidine kinase CheA
MDAEPFAKRLDIPCAAIIRLDGASGRAARVTPAPIKAVEPRPRPTAAATSLRISVPLIDRMMELAGELALVRNQAVRSTDPAMHRYGG